MIVAWVALGAALLAVIEALWLYVELHRLWNAERERANAYAKGAVEYAERRLHERLDSANDVAAGITQRMGEFDARLDVLKGAVEERVSEFLADGYSLGDRVDRLTARLDAQPEPEEEYSPLDEEQKRELRVTWGQVACTTCGFLHPGTCPRIKEMRYQTNGNPERIIFWPDGKWAVPKGAHSYREVFGTEVPQSEETK